MDIKKCNGTDLAPALHIYAEAREFMRSAGNMHQWIGGYPDEATVRADIASGRLYGVWHNGELIAVFYFHMGDDPTYAKIYEGSWKNDAPYGVIHRIAVAKGSHGMGVSGICFDYCYKQCGNLKIDTHKDNIPMQKALLRSGFEYCGIIYLESGEERLAYQRIKNEH